MFLVLDVCEHLHQSVSVSLLSSCPSLLFSSFSPSSVKRFASASVNVVELYSHYDCKSQGRNKMQLNLQLVAESIRDIEITI